MANLARRVREILEIATLVTVFETFDDETEALDSFPRAGAAGRNQESRRLALPFPA